MNYRYTNKMKPIVFSARVVNAAKKSVAARINDYLQEDSQSLDEKLSEIKKIQGADSIRQSLTSEQNKAIGNYRRTLEREFQVKQNTLQKNMMEFDQTVPFVVNSNTQYLTLPFDEEWINGVATANKNTGEFSAAGIATGKARFASALGVRLSSPTPVVAYLRALMPIDYDWGHVVFTSGFAGSSGGVGVLVYETRSGKMVFDRRKQLWNEGMWMASTTTRTGEDRVYLSQTNLAEISFGMTPGSQYLVWYWMWISFHTEGLALSSGTIRAKIPLVVMNTTPPLIVK